MKKFGIQILQFLWVAWLLCGNVYTAFVYTNNRNLAILIWVLEVVALLFFIFLDNSSKKREATKYKKLINQYYSDNDMVKLLWLDKVTFPVIGLTEGDTPIPIQSLEVYQKACLYEPMLYGYDFDHLLDKQNVKFRLEKTKFGEIGKVVEVLRELPVRRAIKEASVPFAEIKEKMLNDINDWNSPYEEYQVEIQQAENIETLTKIMDKVEA